MANDYREAARVFHELTKHSYTSVRSFPHLLDWDIKPLPYKIYPDVPAIDLPRDLKLASMPTLAALAQEPTAHSRHTPLGLDAITRLLFSAGGLTRKRVLGSEEYHFRTVASAGALYPTEIYLATGEIDGLEPALYHFSPADLKLRRLRSGDWRSFIAAGAGDRPGLRDAAAIVLLTSIFWRSTWKYRARAYRYCCWDGGMVLANLTAAATAEQIAVSLVTAFVDENLELLLGVDGRREGVLALATLGTSSGPALDSPVAAPLAVDTIPLSSREVEYDPLLKIHAESRLLNPDQVRSIGDAVVRSHSSAELSASAATPHLDPVPVTSGFSLGETFLRRGSTRVFARVALPAPELAAILATSRNHPRGDFPRLTETYLIVNAVEGLATGAYYYRFQSGDFDLLKAGDFRAESGYLCLEQPLGADCSALIVYMADLESALAGLGNRGYRDVHLEAGILGGRAYLGAYALGRGATGLTFYDDDTAAFFAPHAEGKSPLLMVAVGIARSART